ncbi:MAG: uracil phosphoribosyltransferase, partial [Promethearchaeia archaeon]
MLIDEALALFPSTPVTIETPCGPYAGCKLPDESSICAVSILRAADCMLGEVRNILPSCSVGKILIQRNEETAEPVLMYEKLPPDIAGRPVLLCDPMLATGGSAVTAIQVLVDKGVPPKNIIFVTVVCVKEG